MENTILLLQILGIIYTSIGAGMLLDSKYYHRIHNDFFKNHALMYVTAIVIISVGFFIIKIHNIWSKGWEIVITILGWILLIKGVLLLIFPSRFLNQFENMFKKQESFTYYGLVILAIGLAFSFFGFIY